MKQMTDRTQILESMPVGKAIRVLAVPTMVAMLIQVIYNMTDTFFIGKLEDANMVAAISLCMPIFMLVQAFGNIFAIGGASLISRMLGEGNREKANHAASISFWAATAFCTVAAIFGLIYMEPILRLCGASTNTMGYSKSYLFVMLFGSPFMGMQMAMGGLLRSEGATRESMIGMMSGSILNMLLDPIMIFALHMNIAGAALATVIGNIAGFGYYVTFYMRKKGILSVGFSNFSLQGWYYGEIFKIGIPASLGMMLMSIGGIIGNVFAAGFGDAVVAANGVVMRATSITFMLVFGLAQGCQPLMGYSYGAGNYKRLFETVRRAVITGSIMCICFAVTFYSFADIWIRVFIVDEAVISYGIRIMHVLSYTMPLLGLQMILMMMFQSLGKSVQSLVISIGRQGLFFIPSLILFSRLWGFNGFIFAQPFSDFLTTALSFTLFLLMRKKMKQTMIDTQASMITPETMAAGMSSDH